MTRLLIVVLYGMAGCLLIGFVLDLKTVLDTWNGKKDFLEMLRPGFGSLAYAAVVAALGEQLRLSLRIAGPRAAT
jgi:hypothetical protein